MRPEPFLESFFYDSVYKRDRPMILEEPIYRSIRIYSVYQCLYCSGWCITDLKPGGLLIQVVCDPCLVTLLEEIRWLRKTLKRENSLLLLMESAPKQRDSRVPKLRGLTKLHYQILYAVERIAQLSRRFRNYWQELVTLADKSFRRDTTSPLTGSKTSTRSVEEEIRSNRCQALHTWGIKK